MMTSTAPAVIGGVDTHADVHVAAALDARTGRLLDTESFPATGRGYEEFVEWLTTLGPIERVGVESTGSYGAGLTRALMEHQVEVIEVDRPDRKARRFDGKSDPIDAIAAARAVLSGRASSVPKSRDGAAEALRALEVVYRGAVKDRTRSINQFKSLLISAPQQLRTRFALLGFADQLALARRINEHHDDAVEAATRLALKELARHIKFLDEQIDRIEPQIHQLAASTAPALLGLQGVGAHVAAQLLAAAGDNPDRMRSEAAIAKLCGSCPIPASSGKTTRHRLNRGGDRRANNALFTIVLVRMRWDPRTRDSVARRTTEGKSRLEIMRCLKRFVAREVYQAITNPPTDIPTGDQLRELRANQGLTLTTVCNAVGTAPINLSRLERGLHHDNDLARRTRAWLTEPATCNP